MGDGIERATGPAGDTYRRPPGGDLVWIHRAPETDVDALSALLSRLRAEDDGLDFIVTGSGPDMPDLSLQVAAPPDSAAGARAFLDKWDPSLLVWMRGRFLSSVLNETDHRHIPRLLVEADAAALGSMRKSWLGGGPRSSVRGFHHVLAADAEAVARLRRAGLDDSKIELSGVLDEGAIPRPGNERLRAGLATTLGGRPVWFAPGVEPEEIPLIGEAHRKAIRHAHRLLLVVGPKTSESGPALAELLDALGFPAALRSEGFDPTEECKAIIADDPDEIGTWYRLAPITFMGGSVGSGSTRSPLEPAALGSAVLHGPSTGIWEPAFRRLKRAGASRQAASAAELGARVVEMLAPDSTAALAHAAWQEISSGAIVTNRVMELIRDTLDTAGA
ncbi:3-deoxy-D-manno-octulosonic acid transferase [Pelagovum pacificum]|nr:glycosyltransferase N-terminal domain-containing protein [Pelagovum pacificum]QQA43063.1 hypothetical protein I8N54_00350 [Pelagovum pacificum]